MNRIKVARNDESFKFISPGKFGFNFKDVGKWEIIDHENCSKSQYAIRVSFYGMSESLYWFDTKEERDNLEQHLTHFFLYGYLVP